MANMKPHCSPLLLIFVLLLAVKFCISQGTVSIQPSGALLLDLNQSITLTCNLTSNADNAATYRWDLNGYLIRNNSNPDYNISYTDASSTTQGGTYHCTVYKNDGTIVPSVNSVLVAFAPLITVSPQSTGVMINGSVQFTCNVTSSPTSTIQWARVPVGTPIGTVLDELTPYFNNLPNNSFQNVSDSTDTTNSSTLIIDPVLSSDFGNYICVGILYNDTLTAPMSSGSGIGLNLQMINMVSIAISNASTLSVSPNGTVQVNPLNQTSQIGSDVNFTCSAEGGPNNTFAWIRSVDVLNANEALISQRPVNVSAVLSALSPTATGDTLSLSSVNATQNGGEYICVAINEAGAGSSSTANLYVRPEITTQPINQYVRQGGTVTLTCIADSFPAPTYQWQRMNMPGQFDDLSGETNTTYTIANVVHEDFGRYRCEVTTPTINEVVNSSVALITVSPDGSISVDPPSQTVKNGEDASFTCSANGGPNNAYAWIRSNDSDILNDNSFQTKMSQQPVNINTAIGMLSPFIIQNGTTLSLSSINAAQDGGGYICVAINEAGTGSSSIANLYVRPEITTQPINQYVRRGDNVTLTCIADSFPAPTYQWEFFNTMLESFIPIPAGVSGTNPVLAIGEVEYQGFGTFRCNVTTEIINETITSNEAVVTISPEGSSNISPQFATVDNGNSITFTCSAGGGPNNVFAWIRSNVTLTNNSELQSAMTQRPIDVSTVLSLVFSFIIENGTTFSLSSINATQDGGEYTCIVVNEAGTEATTATLYVRPTFTTQPINQYVRPGDSVTLTCIADSFPAPNYQWQRMNMATKQFQDLSGDTDTTYTITNVVHGDFGRYRCEVTAPTMNELLVANSSAAIITVSPTGSVSVTPSNQTESRNGSVTFNCTSDGGPNTTIVWIRGADVSINDTVTPLDVETVVNELNILVEDSLLELESINGTNGGLYTCIAINEAGYDNSTVTLYVRPEITTQPTNQFVDPGDTVTLTCIADSFPAPTYQWQRMNTTTGQFDNLSGETATTYTINDVEHEDFGRYRCEVTTPTINEVVNSRDAIIAVSTNESVFIEPSFSIANNGSNVMFTCSAQGGPNNTFVWVRTTELTNLMGSSNINQLLITEPFPLQDVLNTLSSITLATGPMYSISSVNATQNGGSYTCYALNSAGFHSNVTVLYVRPVIVEDPMEQYVNNGDSVDISCRADSFPALNYQWEYMNRTTGTFEALESQTSSVLSFTSIEFDQYGRYRCVATANGIVENAISVPALITVSPNGSVSVDPTLRIVDNGSDTTFTCSARGGPNNTIAWIRSVDILSNNQFQTLTSQQPVNVSAVISVLSPIATGGTLSLSSINATQNGGGYICVVVNEAGTGSNSTATLYVRPVIVEDPMEQYVNNGDSVDISCRADSFPAPNYQWEYMNRTTGTFEALEGQTSSVLSFTSIEFDQYGRYRCVATANGIVENAISVPALITVSPNGSVSVDPILRIVDNGSDTTFTCSARGGPNNTIAWIRSFNESQLQALISQRPVNVSAVLNELSPITTGDTLSRSSINATQDGGGYICVVVNEAGADANSTLLYVRPAITIQPQTIQTLANVSVSISCLADSFPAPFYMWEKLNTSTGNYETVPGSNNSVLAFTSIDYEDNGVYRCIARADGIVENATSDNAVINVSPLGSVFISPQITNSFNGTTVTLTCNARGGPMNRFTWTYQRTGEQVSSESEYNFTSSIYTGGGYECLVSNSAGNQTNNATVNVGPVITVNPVSTNVSINTDHIVLSCEAIGIPVPYITWIHNGTITLNTDGGSGTFSNDVSVVTNVTLGTIRSELTVSTAITVNSGDYVCNATSPVDFYSPVTSETALVLVQAVPDTPINLTPNAVTSRNFTLTWIEPHDNNAPILGYHVFYNEPQFFGSNEITLTVMGSMETRFVSGLHPGVHYMFTVIAFNEEGNSSRSQPLTVLTLEEAPSGFPQNLDSETVDDRTINVTWGTVMVSQTNGNITGYTIYVTTDVSFVDPFNVVINDSNVFMYTFSGLQEYVNYTFSISASTAAGEGPASDTVTSLTDEAIPDSSPDNFTVVATTPNNITLSWSTPPIEDINGVIDTYTIRYRILEQLGITNVSDTVLDVTVPGSNTVETLTMLFNYTVYEITISANTIGEGPNDTLVQRTAENVPGAPPTTLDVTTNSTTTINITWSPPPLGVTFGIIRFYEIQYGEYNATSGELMNGTDPIRQVNTTDNSTFDMTFDGLQEAREYGFQVRAYTVGPGPYTSIVTNTTFTAPPAVAPEQPVAPPENETEPTSITLSWEPIPIDQQNGDLTYDVAIIVVGQQTSGGNTNGRRKRNTMTPNSLEACLTAAGINASFNVDVPGNQSSLMLTSIAPYTQYSFNVTGVTSAGRGPTSSSIPFSTPQGAATAPMSLSVMNTSTSSSVLDITWDVPLCDNGVRTGYTITYEPLPTALGPMGDIGNPPSPILLGVNDRNQMITGLTPNTPYRVSICANNSAGCGVNSTQDRYTRVDAPREISNEQIMNPVSSQIVITWDLPSARNGTFLLSLTYSAVQNFNYQTQPTRTQTIQNSTVLSGTTTGHTINNALPFAYYDVTITAYNELFGTSLSSSPVALRILTSPIPATQVTSFFASTQNSSSIFLSWDVPLLPNGQITSYTISFTRTSTAATETRSTTALSYVLTNLTAGEVYDITVQPITVFNNMQYDGAVSNVISINISTTSDITISNSTLTNTDTFTFTITLPRPSSFSTSSILFYGIIVSNVNLYNPPRNLDLEQQYPNPQRYSGSSDQYYLTAGFADATDSNVPTTFVVGDGGTTTASDVMYFNAGLERRTTYRVLLIVEISSGVPGQNLVRYVDLVQVTTMLGYNEPALGFFMTLIIILIIVAIVAVIVFIIYKKYRKGFYSFMKREYDEKELKPVKPESSIVIRNAPAIGGTETVNGTYYDNSVKRPILVNDFPAHVSDMHSNDDYLFSVEYPTIEPQHHPTTEATHHPDNAIKNRYANITSYDHSRVRLHEIPNVPGSDYINGNYIDRYNKPNGFIATQGPVPHSIPDFWRMVWEQNTCTIVMLTNLEEKGRIKCHLYWPASDKKVVVHGQIRIELQEELCLTDYTIRTFSLQHKDIKDERIIKQFHFTSWPDFGVPEHPTTLLRFIHKVSTSNPDNAGPIVIHCSAGVGRTGTFITISSQIERILDQKSVDIFNFVQSMRFKRCFMVQTEAQYIFIHDALLEYLECGETEVAARDVKEQYQQLGLITDKEQGKTELEKEFDNIQSTIHKEPIVYAGTQPFNRQKNRYANVMPFDKTRCKLSTVPGIDGSDYINANFIEGYHKGKAFIATQGPLPDTADDLWRMVWEHKCASVIMLANEREGAKAMCHKYWPDTGSEMYGSFEVTLYSHKEYPDYVLREFKIVDSRDPEGSSQHVKQFQYISWPSQGVPNTAVGLLDVREQVEKWQRNSGDKPIIVHCSGGCGRTGTYIAICLLIDRLKTEGLVDVFQTVRGLRLQRPGMVRSVDQYEFCYKSVLEYLGSFDTYANFSL